MRIADGEYGGGAGDDGRSDDSKALGRDEPGDARRKRHQRKGPDAGNARSGLKCAQVEPAFDSDQQAAGERGAERQGQMIPGLVQIRRSACQRKWPAMKVETK